MHGIWKCGIFSPLVVRTNSSHVSICFVIAGNGFRNFLIALKSFVVDVGWACWYIITACQCRSARDLRQKLNSQFPVCRPDEFKISQRQQRPASTHFKFTEAASTHFIFKSDQTCNICGSYAGRVGLYFGFQLSLIWCTGSGNRWRSSLEARDHFWRWDDSLPIRITPLQTCKSCLITLKPWSSASFDLCWCRMDLFPTKTKQVNWGLANFFPAGHLKSTGWPFRQVCDRFPYFIHFRDRFNRF